MRQSGIVRTRVYTGSGVRDQLLRISPSGIEEVRWDKINGIRTLVPASRNYVSLANSTPDKVGGQIAASPNGVSLADPIIKSFPTKSKATLSIVKEINKSLRGGMIKTF